MAFDENDEVVCNMESKVMYGMTPDGRLTPCRAKDPEHCPYHRKNSHKQMTSNEASRLNEAVIRAGNIGKHETALKKDGNSVKTKNEYLDYIKDLYMDSNAIYDTARSAMMKMEQDYRMPVTKVSTILPDDDVFEKRPENVNRHEWRDTMSNRELKYLMASSTEDISGRTLVGDESKIISDELRKYAERDIDRGMDSGLTMEPTPAEERALRTLMSNPLAGDDENTTSLVDNDKVMEFGARFVVNSPYMNDEQKKSAFMSAPENAVESQSLDSELVNKALTDESLANGSKRSRQRLLRGALSNPNVDPDLAYAEVMKARNSDYWNAAQKNDFDWQLSLNPNPDVTKRIYELDSANDGKLMATKQYEQEMKKNRQ